MSLAQDPGKGSKIALTSGAKHLAGVSMNFLLFPPFCKSGKPGSPRLPFGRWQEGSGKCHHSEVVWLGGGRGGI